MNSDTKVQPQHLQCNAILYIRQSSAFQATHNRESQALYYAMRDQLRVRGWHEIEVIDEDLGCSAAGHVTRTGFERMVTEVCLGHVGVVAAREVSRFARNSHEWQQLVEVCRVVDTRLHDQDTVSPSSRVTGNRLRSAVAAPRSPRERGPNPARGRPPGPFRFFPSTLSPRTPTR